MNKKLIARSLALTDEVIRILEELKEPELVEKLRVGRRAILDAYVNGT